MFAGSKDLLCSRLNAKALMLFLSENKPLVPSVEATEHSVQLKTDRINRQKVFSKLILIFSLITNTQEQPLHVIRPINISFLFRGFFSVPAVVFLTLLSLLSSVKSLLVNTMLFIKRGSQLVGGRVLGPYVSGMKSRKCSMRKSLLRKN